MLEKTYNPKTFENGWYQRWVDTGSFSCDPSSKADPYTIMMPPPNVTGSLHIGHALTFTLQDILIRYNRMQGKDALWQPGTDHAGIATQMVVERMINAEGIDRRDLGRDKFLERVWQWKDESGGTISRQLQSLGASADWPRQRFTMDEGLSHAVRKVFVKMHRQGLIYRDKRLVNWDPKLKTAISDLEVETIEKKGHYWHLTYPIEGGKDEFITVATTRPETMLGDTAVAVHPDDERYAHLIGGMVRLPIVDRLIPIVADEYSDMEKGTGAVKITPAHDFNDFELGRRHGLEMINIFDADAKLNENTPKDWQGLDRFTARKRVVQEFEEMGLLAEVTDTVHTVPHGDRSGVVVEPWLMDQWYVDAETLAKPAIKAVEDGLVKIIPSRWEKTYFEWMRNIQPWCVSRQLWWGHRIPVWYGPDGTPFVGMDADDVNIQATAHYGKNVTLTQDEDVLDTWFSSGLWPFSTLGWPEDTAEVKRQIKRYYPSDVLVTGFDIIFFWVARMMMMSMHFMDGEVPFKEVYIHALVRDEKGQKMSKSKGNVMDPLVLSDKYGADALRFTLAAMAAQGRDIKLAEGHIEGYRNFATKIWNACRFLEMRNCFPLPNVDLSMATAPADKWIIHELAATQAAVRKAIEEYRFNEAADAIYKFIWSSYCDWYIELIKPIIIFDSPPIEAEREKYEMTCAVAGRVMAEAIRILHPFMPFITEELWEKTVKGEGMLITSPWAEISIPTGASVAAVEISFIIDLIIDIRSIKDEMNIPASVKPELQLMPSDYKDAINDNIPQIIRLARVKMVEFNNPLPKKSARGVTRGQEFALLYDIDVDAERARLTKDINSIVKEIEKIEGKLNNQGFIAKAPEHVVAENRRRLAAENDTKSRLMLALERLA
ncbi:MAG: valine--tRNA ligase [Candidatus Puniceispirillales bacterium WSBS_2018_MAG_OTU23]